MTIFIRTTKKLFVCIMLGLAFICICLFCSCNTSTTNIKQDEAQNIESSVWKEAYLKYIEELDMQWKKVGSYYLLNICKGNVPALYIEGDNMAMGGKLAYYYKGDIKVLTILRCGFEYIEDGNKVKNSDGNMGTYYDLIYSFHDGDFQLIFDGHYGDKNNSKPEVNPDGSMKYVYKIYENEVDKSEYDKQLNETYDMNNSKKIKWRTGLMCGEMQKQLSQ